MTIKQLIILHCDICGDESTITVPVPNPHNPRIQLAPESLNSPNTQLDLCIECGNFIKSWIRLPPKEKANAWTIFTPKELLGDVKLR